MGDGEGSGDAGGDELVPVAADFCGKAESWDGEDLGSGGDAVVAEEVAHELEGPCEGCAVEGEACGVVGGEACLGGGAEESGGDFRVGRSDAGEVRLRAGGGGPLAGEESGGVGWLVEDFEMGCGVIDGDVAGGPCCGDGIAMGEEAVGFRFRGVDEDGDGSAVFFEGVEGCGEERGSVRHGGHHDAADALGRGACPCGAEAFRVRVRQVGGGEPGEGSGFERGELLPAFGFFVAGSETCGGGCEIEAGLVEERAEFEKVGGGAEGPCLIALRWVDGKDGAELVEGQVEEAAGPEGEFAGTEFAGVFRGGWGDDCFRGGDAGREEGCAAAGGGAGERFPEAAASFRRGDYDEGIGEIEGAVVPFTGEP